MKIPTRVTPRTQEPSTPLAPLQVSADANAFGAQIGQGLTAFGKGVVNFAEEEIQKNQKLEDFEAQRRLTEQQTIWGTESEERKRNWSPDGRGYRADSEQAFDTQFGAFTQTLPERLRPQYAAKIAELRKSATFDAFNFERSSADATFRNGISDETTKAKTAVNSVPDEFDRWNAHLNETIDKSGLAPLEKEKLKRESQSALAQVLYRAQARAGTFSAVNMPVQGGVDVFVDRIVQVESSGDPSAKNPRSTATGLGQFTADTWIEQLRLARPDLAMGQPPEALLALRLDPQVSRDVTRQYATQNATILQQAGFAPTPGNIYLAHFLGPEGAKRVLSARDETPITSLVSTDAAKANKEVFSSAPTAGALKEWAIGKMGGRSDAITVRATQDPTTGFWSTPGVEYDLAGKVRPLPPSKEYVERVMTGLSTVEPGLGMRVTSGGQRAGEGTGSHRHDVDAKGEAGTTDFVLTRNGKPVRPADDPKLYARAMEELAAQGFTGIGHYSWGIHVGSGSRAVWGPDRSAASVNPEFARAVQRGWSRAGDNRRDALDTDPRFASIPYEDRVALRMDGQREATAQVNEQVQLAAAQRKQQIDQLNVALLDGKAGQADIDRMRAQGILTSYEDIRRSMKILEDRDTGQSQEREGLQKLASNGVFDPTSTDDKKLLNAVIGEKGLTQIAAGDKQYFSDNVIPVVQRSRDIPTSVVGALMGMMRSQDPARAIYGLDALAQLERAEGRAYVDRVPEDVRRDISRYQLLRNVMPQEQLLKTINLGEDQESRQAMKVRMSEAQDLLAKKDGSTPKIENVVKEVIDQYDGIFNLRPEINFQTAEKLTLQAQAIWQTEYALHGKADVAQAVTNKLLKERWGVTQIGGKSQLMELPPEKAGYKALGGGYDWIDRQVRKELKLAPDAKYQLISDEQTRQEFASAQRNVDGRPPSYKVVLIDKDGVPRDSAFAATGGPKRIWFKPEAADVQAEIDAFDRQNEIAANAAFERDYAHMQFTARGTGIPIPPEVEEERARRAARTIEMQKQDRQKLIDMERNWRGPLTSPMTLQPDESERNPRGPR